MVLRNLIKNVMKCSNSNIQSLRCLSTQLSPSQHKFLPHAPPAALLSHLIPHPTRSTTPCLSFQQPCAAKTYDSITRMNLGRSKEEVEKCDYVPDFVTTPLAHTQREIPIQPKKLILAANLVNRRPIEDALAQAKFSPRRSCYYVHEALLVAQRKAVERGMDPELLWVSSSSVKRESLMKRIQYKGRGRSGTIKSYQCTYHCVLSEGKPPLAKKIKRNAKNLPEGQKQLRFPKTIKNSLASY